MHAYISGFSTGPKSGGFFGSIKRAIALIAAFGVGALVLMAAGVLAIATAIVGVIIAFVAMLLRFGAFKRSVRASASSSDAAGGNPGVLEARRTARGWTVDG
ncbi:MAG: hypothetical protein CMK07_07640 [Ponticaulis sp.]|nr:hypothetical protein [Ponticaulis sp.]